MPPNALDANQPPYAARGAGRKKMKGFFGGIIATIVAGLIVYIISQQYDQWVKASSQKVDFSFHEKSITLDKPTIEKLLKDSSEPIEHDTSIDLVTVTNLGSDDIADKSFSMPASGIVAYQTTDFPNGNPNNAIVSFKNDVLTVKYKLLPKGQSHKFWLASGAFSTVNLGKFSADASGISVSMDGGNDFSWTPSWFETGVISALAVILGALIGYGILAESLKSRGVDLAEIMKQKPISSSEDKEK